MQFQPNIHTKQYLLENPQVAFGLLVDEQSSDLAASEYAQDIEFLSLKDDSGLTIAHQLAARFKCWQKSPAAQRFEVLSLADADGFTVAHTFAMHVRDWDNTEAAQDIHVLKLVDRFSNSVAHTLASYGKNWMKTPAAQDLNVLLLTHSEGNTVAHNLAGNRYQNDWGLTPQAQNIKILGLKGFNGDTVAHYLAKWNTAWGETQIAQSLELLTLRNDSGYSVAHALAASNSSWGNTDACKRMEVLSIYDKEHGTVAHQLSFSHYNWRGCDASRRKEVLMLHHNQFGSVAQAIMYRIANKSDVLLDLIRTGAAYSQINEQDFNYRPIFNEDDIKYFIKDSFELIDDEHDELIKIKIMIAFYSTLKNLENDFSIEQAQKLFNKPLNVVEGNILSIINGSPALFSDTSTLHDFNCEPALSLINHHLSSLHMQNSISTLQQGEESQSPVYLY